MSTMREFTCDDLFKFNNVNMDKLTETYNLGFYLQYITTWPDFNYTVEAPDGRIQGYILGKAEGKGDQWHGHVTALTVAPEARRVGLAKRLMNILEQVSELIYDGYFVDLFVRQGNKVAIGMYSEMGYITYRRVLGYYSGEEDGLDMHKALARDVEKKSMIALSNPVRPEDIDY